MNERMEEGTKGRREGKERREGKKGERQGRRDVISRGSNTGTKEWRKEY